jgi:hypothetical protein
MSLERLRGALVKMPPTGEPGFEGLAAALLTALTGDPYYLCRVAEPLVGKKSLFGSVAACMGPRRNSDHPT